MITQEQRDRDIHTLSAVNFGINSIPGLLFLLTGSYAIEALIQSPIDHNDMDGNIIAGNLVQAIARTATLIGDLKTEQGKPQLFKQTNDRLEYKIGQRALEFQLVEASTVSNVPLASVQLKDSKNEEFGFRVKSLAYTIATWAIRVSGLAGDQKRPVNDSDLQNFARLLTTDYKYDDVVSLMRSHPQMPKDIDASRVFKQALEIRVPWY